MAVVLQHMEARQKELIHLPLQTIRPMVLSAQLPMVSSLFRRKLQLKNFLKLNFLLMMNMLHPVHP